MIFLSLSLSTNSSIESISLFSIISSTKYEILSVARNLIFRTTSQLSRRMKPMRTFSIIVFTGILLLWGAYFLLKDTKQQTSENLAINGSLGLDADKVGSVLNAKRKRELDQIGAVINKDTVQLDEDTKRKIKSAKVGYDNKEGVRELQSLLEQSYLDPNSSLKDIKRIQAQIVEKKLKLKQSPTNTEKWDPKFVYYLMIQENYTYPEINMIRSLAENGLNIEEIEYIKELILEESFNEKITAFKNKTEVEAQAVTAKKKNKKVKEVDEFITDVDDGTTIEDKLIEMNYNESQKEEMRYGNNQ